MLIFRTKRCVPLDFYWLDESDVECFNALLVKDVDCEISWNFSNLITTSEELHNWCRFEATCQRLLVYFKLSQQHLMADGETVCAVSPKACVRGLCWCLHGTLSRVQRTKQAHDIPAHRLLSMVKHRICLSGWMRLCHVSRSILLPSFLLWNHLWGKVTASVGTSARQIRPLISWIHRRVIHVQIASLQIHRLKPRQCFFHCIRCTWRYSQCSWVECCFSETWTISTPRIPWVLFGDVWWLDLN